MAAAYSYAEDSSGPTPRELALSWNIERYGVQAVMGRAYLGAGEIKRMNLTRNVYNAYLSRANYRDKDEAENWAEWAGKYPELNALLTNVEMMMDQNDG